MLISLFPLILRFLSQYPSSREIHVEFDTCAATKDSKVRYLTKELWAHIYPLTPVPTFSSFFLAESSTWKPRLNGPWVNEYLQCTFLEWCWTPGKNWLIRIDMTGPNGHGNFWRFLFAYIRSVRINGKGDFCFPKRREQIVITWGQFQNRIGSGGSGSLSF